MPEEKPARGHRRFKVSLPLWVRFREGIRKREGSKQEPTESLLEEERTITTDIGSGGCFFYSSRKPRVGASATLLVDVPTGASRTGSGKVLCRGKVVRVSEKQVQGKVGVACKIESYRFRPPETN
jgi:hypothetical protein